MKVIIKRTLQETLRISSILLVIVAAAVGGFVAGKAATYYNLPAFDYYLNECLLVQHLAVFFLINGAVLMILVSSVSSGLIAGEVHEGTIRLLVSKPNSRRTILLGKIIGVVIGEIVLMLMGLGIFMLVETLTGSFDGNIIAELVGYFPAYVIYGFIVIVFFNSLATLFSCLFKKKVIALLPMLFLIICILGVPVIVRVVMLISRKPALPAIVNYIDVNYHFGSILKWCCSLFGGIHGTSGQLEIPSILLNIFTSTSVDQDIIRAYGGPSLITENNAIPMLTLVIIYCVLTVVNYVGSFTIISRKDV